MNIMFIMLSKCIHVALNLAIVFINRNQENGNRTDPRKWADLKGDKCPSK